MKPFQPSWIKKITPTSAESSSAIDGTLRPSKRRHVDDDETSHQPASKVRRIETRSPLLAVDNTVTDSKVKASEDDHRSYYTVLWRKFTMKKHKTWDGDGVLSVSGGYATLQNIDGRNMGKTLCDRPLLPGSTLSVGGKDVEVDSIISKADFLAGKPFVRDKDAAQDLESKPNVSEKVTQPPIKPRVKLEKSARNATVPTPLPKTVNAASRFKNPYRGSTVLPKKNGQEPTPRHDPKQSGALVMKRPNNVPEGKQIVDVVVDPILQKHLREHQREGVKFLYECVMGMRPFDGQGAILADEMGLGKTLQTIALLWTLLKQNPIHGDPPVIKKALIVCPVTLINNWRNEFKKWLGNERIGVFVVDGTKSRLSQFTHGKVYSVMIIGYERLRTVQEELRKGAGIDIVIADEGHRLKTVQNKSSQAIQALNTDKRVILSGTPMQNDLSEFFAMVDFVNPGLLGTFKSFTKEFEVPIVKSRQPNATEKEKEKGESQSEELSSLTKPFILRRTAEILSKYLPPKTEYVLFCRPTAAQATVYRHVLASPLFQSALGSPETSLQLITILKKLCNGPSLLKPKPNQEPSSADTPSSAIAEILSELPKRLLHPAASIKIRILDSFLHTLFTTTSEKIVLVSHYTKTLDLLGTLLASLDLPFLRLDGSTPSSKRSALVESFNSQPPSTSFAFLLSAKSGGAGLNLIGASRLVLFDCDWNPAADMQAMARIHRDGQKNHCRIYRFLLMGAIDERIFMRQVSKLGLADSVVDGKKGGSETFTMEELRDLFKLDESGVCKTHEFLGCPCEGRGEHVSSSDEENGPHAEGEDSNDDDDDDSSLSDIPTLIQASKVNMETQERKIEQRTLAHRNKNKKVEMQSLMQYLHIDTSKLLKPDTDGSGDEEESGGGGDNDDDDDTSKPIPNSIIDDDVLRKLLQEKGSSGIGYVFSKTSS